MSEPRVVSVQLDDDNTITIGWTDEEANDDHGGTFYQSVLTEDGQAAEEQVAYWTKEVRQSLDELLAAWIRYRRPRPTPSTPSPIRP